MTRVFGRVHTMAALVITGNGKGLAGYAVGKVYCYVPLLVLIFFGSDTLVLCPRTLKVDFPKCCKDAIHELYPYSLFVPPCCLQVFT